MMDAPVEKPPIAWQPLTPRGVAAFARATPGRLLLVQWVFSLLTAAVMVWFLSVAWFPVIRGAISGLPPGGKIVFGKLTWAGDSPKRLADGRFLALAVDLKHEGGARSPAHIQVEFGERDIEVRSLLGFLPLAYPSGPSRAFNREELEPWWGAWAPEILALAAGATSAGLMLSWALLATVYWVPVWLAGFFANRDLNWRGSWRLAGAALMPGALFFTGTIVLYRLGGLDPVQLGAAAGVHLVIGWGYLCAGVLALPRHPEAAVASRNPFTPAAKPDEKTGEN
jgi:uncharacterized membrane protein YgdD (TMEM256/DUF423 family)